MRLSDLKRSGTERHVYAGPVADVDGNKRYELAITGQATVVEEVFAKCDFDVEIAPGVSPDAFEEHSKRFLKRHMGDRKLHAPRLDDITALLDREPPRVPQNLKDGIVVYLRPTEGAGTFWGMVFPFVGLLPGLPIAFVLPRVWTTWSYTIPMSGNPNLLLFRDAPVPPAVATSLAAGLLLDSVAFTVPPWPWAQFHPWHVLFSAVPGIASATYFAVGGHSVPWAF